MRSADFAIFRGGERAPPIDRHFPTYNPLNFRMKYGVWNNVFPILFPFFREQGLPLYGYGVCMERSFRGSLFLRENLSIRVQARLILYLLWENR